MSINLESGQTIVFFGDSITDCGRRAAERPLGSGYVKLFGELLTIREPAKQLNIINKGIGGNRVTDLQARLEDDVIRHKPDLVSFLIGINDLHSHWRNLENGVSPEQFDEVYDEVLSRIKTVLPECRLLIMSPFYMSINSSPNSFRLGVLELLPQYIRVAEKMAGKYGAKYVDLHQKYQEIMRYHDADTVCPEPVHPNHAGHLMIAEAVYEALSS